MGDNCNLDSMSGRHLRPLQAALREASEQQLPNAYWQYSTVWRSLINNRDADTNMDQLHDMLGTNSRIVAGVAGRPSDALRMLPYYAHWVTAELLDTFPLSTVGSPDAILWEGRRTCLPHMENLALYVVLQRALEQAGFSFASRKHVVEIGAGYGGLASLLITGGGAGTNSYTIVDLPENLSLSAFYLTQQFPNWPWQVVTRSSEPLLSRGFLFCPPGNIDVLKDRVFDLAINTNSMGEMAAGTAQAYVAWIAEHLDANGIFVSKNCHRRTAEGIQRVSEYGYQRLGLALFEGSELSSGLWDQHAHIAVLARGSRSGTIDWSDVDIRADRYCLGLTHDPVGDSANTFLAGIKSHLARDRRRTPGLLERYLEGRPSALAAATTLFLLAQYEGRSALDRPLGRLDYVKVLLAETERMLRLPWGARHAAFALRNEVLRKKMAAWEEHRPSLLWRVTDILRQR